MGMRETYLGLVERLRDLKELKNSSEATFQELTDHIYPEGADFQTETTAGAEERELLYDSTGTEACTTFAADFTAATVPRDKAWLQLAHEQLGDFRDSEVNEWLQIAEAYLLKQYANQHSAFYSAQHEANLAMGYLGTAVIFQEWNGSKKSLMFKSLPLANCYIDTNYWDRVDTLFYCFKKNKRQLLHMFKEEELPRIIRETKAATKKWEICHAVYPREDAMPGRPGAKNMPWASVYFMETDAAQDDGIIREGGYENFPYTVHRWMIKEGEVYGRSPGSVVLPKLRMLQEMEKAQLEGVQKAVSPSYLAPSDAITENAEAVPNGVIEIDPAVDPRSITILHPGDYQVGEDKLEKIRQSVRDAFYNGLFERFRKNERQTAFEVDDDRTEMLTRLGSYTARIEDEGLTEEVNRSLFLLEKHGIIPPRPAQITDLEVIFVGASAVAQSQSNVLKLRGFITTDLVPAMQVDPSIASVIDWPNMIRYMALHMDVPTDVLKTDDELAEEAEGQAQQQQAQQLIEAGPAIADTLKGVSEAAGRPLDLSAIGA